jgi:hypothetical protein
MRRITRLSVLIVLAFMFTIAQAQTAVPVSSFPELEPITMENAARLVQLPGELTGVNEGFAVSPDGTQIAVARLDGVYLYDLGNFETPATIFEIQGADDVYGPQFSPDGKLLAVNVIYRLSEGDNAENFRSVTQLWNVEKEILADEIVLWLALGHHAVFSPDGRYLAGNDNLYQTNKNPNSQAISSLYIWSLNDSLPAERLDGEFVDHYVNAIPDIEFSPDNLTVLWSISEANFNDGGAGYTIENYWQLEYLPPFLTPDSDLGLMAGMFRISGDNFISRSEKIPFAVDVSDVEFSRDGVWLATVGEYSKIWQIETVALKTTLAEGSKFSAFLSDNSLLSIDENNGTLYVTDLDLSKKVIIFEDYDAVKQTSFLSLDGKLLTLDDNGAVHFYGIPTESE